MASALLRLGDHVITEKRYREFWARVDIADAGTCWLWKGKPVTKGYGRLDWRIDRRIRPVRAHVLAYFLTRGPVPIGRVLHHTCHTKLCCNPSHLSAVTPSEHSRIHEAENRVTQCANGHPFDEVNTRISAAGWRYCAICSREKSRRWKERRRVAVVAQSRVDLGELEQQLLDRKRRSDGVS